MKSPVYFASFHSFDWHCTFHCGFWASPTALSPHYIEPSQHFLARHTTSPGFAMVTEWLERCAEGMPGYWINVSDMRLTWVYFSFCSLSGQEGTMGDGALEVKPVLTWSFDQGTPGWICFHFRWWFCQHHEQRPLHSVCEVLFPVLLRVLKTLFPTYVQTRLICSSEWKAINARWLLIPSFASDMRFAMHIPAGALKEDCNSFQDICPFKIGQAENLIEQAQSLTISFNMVANITGDSGCCLSW